MFAQLSGVVRVDEGREDDGKTEIKEEGVNVDELRTNEGAGDEGSAKDRLFLSHKCCRVRAEECVFPLSGTS